jgi:hypothetical protein
LSSFFLSQTRRHFGSIYTLQSSNLLLSRAAVPLVDKLKHTIVMALSQNPIILFVARNSSANDYEEATLRLNSPLDFIERKHQLVYGTAAANRSSDLLLLVMGPTIPILRSMPQYPQSESLLGRPETAMSL